jgi:hypothetical protein
MGVGMPADLYLHQFGAVLEDAFGATAYHVGSSLSGKDGWRDVDVRVLLEDEQWELLALGDPDYTYANGRWVAMCLAFSELGRRMTGLPIDFQLQPREWANAKFPGQRRSALGLVPPRPPLESKRGDD